MRTLSIPYSAPRKVLLAALVLVLAVFVALAVRAQVEGERGIAPVAASADIQVGGIDVDTRGDTSEEAREAGWDEAARLAWEKIDGPSLPDAQISELVSAIVIEREQLGPRRYIARLGVVFDRARASRYLGTEGQGRRSAPMLVIPVTASAGTRLVYEQRNPWQRAWAEFQPGTSLIAYVRPSGAGGDSLLITAGQTGRRSRTWWRNVLDQFGAADVLVPVANLRYTYPGGPVAGTFTARYGPDNRYLGSFEMTADTPDDLPAMLARAVERFDDIFEAALADGTLRPDPTLNLGAVDIDPALQALLNRARASIVREQAAVAREPTEASGGTITAAPVDNPPPEGSVALYTVQVATPDAAAFDASIGAVRGTPGVRSAGVRSAAVGGTSVLTVGYAGSIGDLAGALRARGFTVQQGASALSISR